MQPKGLFKVKKIGKFKHSFFSMHFIKEFKKIANTNVVSENTF